jgi:predicted DNA-binding transcriptional regulator AlpA
MSILNPEYNHYRLSKMHGEAVLKPNRRRYNPSPDQAGGGGVAKRRKRQSSGLLKTHFNRRSLAKFLDVSEPTLARWAAAGEGPPSFFLGGQLVYPKVEVQRWLQERAEEERIKMQEARKRGRPRKPLTGKDE